ncbi:hypothetical protein BN1232_02211 [Mycobacterium lentiflavum]|uniref:Uncharacterized protein n=1 Tax=Mycobacterium lentiflavum TaxID=141349 RepID=A0A0E4H092_MYCLN|nr:hypothetical protein BN1232_02211 [Mycobacterium lentiflavum]
MIVSTAVVAAAVGVGGFGLSIVTFVTGQVQGRAKGKREERAAADAARAADLALKARPTTDQPSRLGEGVYRFRVTNVGRSAAVHLRPLLVDESGEVWSELVDPMVLQPAESTTFTIRARVPSPPLYLDYTWLDDSSGSTQRRSRSNVAVPTNPS